VQGRRAERVSFEGYRAFRGRDATSEALTREHGIR